MSMLGVQMAVTSSQSYCRIPQYVVVVVCRIFIADRTRFAGMIPPLDPRHVGRAVR